MNNFHKHTKVFFIPPLLSVYETMSKGKGFSLDGWMSAMCSDFALNLANLCERLFFFLNPLSQSCCALAEHREHLTNCVVKDVSRVMIPLRL